MKAKQVEKVVAIVPPVKGISFTDGSIPPMGIVRVLTALRASFPNLEVELWDGSQVKQEEIIRRVRALPSQTVVALSAHTSMNYGNCLKVLEELPDGVRAVMGGLHVSASHCGRFAVKNRNMHVIQGQGEVALPQYIEYLNGTRALAEVENIMYLGNGGELCESPIVSRSQMDFLFPEYEGLLDLEPYGSRYNQLFQTADLGLVVMSPEGCRWRATVKRPCLFCDIGTKFVCQPARFLAQWISHHQDCYGHFGRIEFANYADEASGIGPAWWNDVQIEIDRLGLTPGKDFLLKTYVRAGKGFFDSDKIAQAMYGAGVRSTHLGAEGGDANTLLNWNKGCLMMDMRRAVELAGKYEFRLFLSFVFGAPNCKKRNIDSCFEFVNWARTKADIGVVAAGPVMPLPGAETYRMLRDRLGQEYYPLFDTDDPDFHVIQLLWLREMCPDLCRECGDEVLALDYLQNEAAELCRMGSLPVPVNRLE